MLRVLTITTMFPDAVRPNRAPFIERQSRELGTVRGIEVRVIAPLLTGLLPLTFRRGYRWMRSIPHADGWKGLRVYRPKVPIAPHLAGMKPYLVAARLIPLLLSLRRSFAFDVIGAETFWPDGPTAMLLSRFLGVPYLVKGRGDDILVTSSHNIARRQMLSAANHAGRILAVSAALRDRMATLGMPRHKIRVHHNGVDKNLFRPADRDEAKAKLNLHGPVLLCVGSLTERKQQRLIIDALQYIPEATLVLAGTGPERPRLEQQAQDLGLASRVRLLGVVPHEELPAVYAAADLTVLPTKREGLANAWLESLACGRPVVTADAEGAREVIRTPNAGRIVARSPTAIAAAIHDLLADPPDPICVSAAVEAFSWEKSAGELAKHYRDLALNRLN